MCVETVSIPSSRDGVQDLLTVCFLIPTMYPLRTKESRSKPSTDLENRFELPPQARWQRRDQVELVPAPSLIHTNTMHRVVDGWGERVPPIHLCVSMHSVGMDEGRALSKSSNLLDRGRTTLLSGSSLRWFNPTSTLASPHHSIHHPE